MKYRHGELESQVATRRLNRAVLTGIALGATYCNFTWKAAIWTIIGVIATVFIQAAMNAFFSPMGLPTLTGPFCVATWLFLFPNYQFLMPKSN